jgi:RND family efflux transporter MFP subunit
MNTHTSNADLSGLRIQRNTSGGSAGKSFPWRWVIPLLIVLIAAGLYFVLRTGNAGAKEVELATATLTYPSQADAVLTASGYVVAQIKAAVASKGSGRLEYLGVEEGDKVIKGQLLARLEDQDVKASLARAEADLAVVKAELQDARLSYERQKTLLASSLTSQAELDAAEARFHRVEASIQSATASVTAAQVALEQTRIRAPFNGTVLTKNADVGEVFAPFAASATSKGAVVTMADMSSLQVEADVSESNIIRVSVGQPCEIILDAYPEKRYPGRVHKIVPTADRAKATVLTKVSFLERDDRVLPEMSAKVVFLNKDAKAAKAGAAPRLTVPLVSVTTRDGKKTVLRIQEGVVTETPVTIGEIINDRIEVLEGLAQGDSIVLRPDPALTTGSRVTASAK